MNILCKTKKIFILALTTIAALVLFLTIQTVFAESNINTEVVKKKYETNDIYYSDGYFAHKSTEYDPHLASLSILMAKYSMNPGGPKNKDDNEWYNNQSNRVKGFFDLIGFDSFRPNDDYKSRTGFSTIGVAAAKKQVGDYTLIGVAVRSGGYFLEWSNNVYLGDGTKSDYMHEGWYNAANKLISYLNSYVEDYHITGKIKLWMAGFSRGAAVTNLAAGLIDNDLSNNTNNYISKKIDLKHDDLYAYTFETPQGANVNSKTVKDPSHEIYNNIWNVINPNDLVTKVAMAKFGFTRFGTDKFITTKFYDPAGFSENREIFKKVYSQSNTDVNEYKADNFEMRGVTGDKIAGILAGTVVGGPVGGALTGYIISKVTGLTSVDTTKANYDGNILTSIVLDELCNTIGSRENYCRFFQNGIKNVMLTIMTDDDTDKVERMAVLLTNIMLESMLMKFGITNVSIIKTVYSDYSSMNLADIALYAGLFAKVYVERPNEIITLCMNISNLFQNHSTDINVAHVACQDSYYIDGYNNSHEDKIHLVNLKENADLVHFAFNGYNDVQVKDESNNKIVDVDGHVFGKSDVLKCDPTCAVGYYSYITEEKMELFLPVNKKYDVSFKGYSKQLRHRVSYKIYCQYISAVSKNNIIKDHYTYCWFNTDRVNVTVNVKP